MSINNLTKATPAFETGDEDSETFLYSDTDSSTSSSSSDDDDGDDFSSSVAKKTALIDTSRSFQEGLKYNKAEEDNNNKHDQLDDGQAPSPDGGTTGSADTSTITTTASPYVRWVHFHHVVSGVEISSHRDYAPHVRETLWNSFEEIQQNAARNLIEFRADGWEWRNATEESQMLRASAMGGALIHPASYNKKKHGKLAKNKGNSSSGGSKHGKTNNSNHLKKKNKKDQMRQRRRKARQYAV